MYEAMKVNENEGIVLKNIENRETIGACNSSM